MAPDIHIAESDRSCLERAHRFSHAAMAATFEIHIPHDDRVYAEQAAFAAFEELDRLERELSRFIENSDVSRINHSPAHAPVRIGLEAFACLEACKKLYEETGGAFDVTAGLLVDAWRNSDRSPRTPSEDELTFARERTGMHLLELNEADHTVTLKIAPVRVDFGGYGKGYALDVMAKLLREWDIDSALLHGGWSTVLAMKAPPESDGWPAAVSHPQTGETLRRFALKNQALSGSGLRKGPHIIDPRTTKPVQQSRAAWALAPTAAEADALSTAFMVMGEVEAEGFCKGREGVEGIVVGIH